LGIAPEKLPGDINSKGKNNGCPIEPRDDEGKGRGKRRKDQNPAFALSVDLVAAALQAISP
jgi:hypothetical protein